MGCLRGSDELNAVNMIMLPLHSTCMLGAYERRHPYEVTLHHERLVECASSKWARNRSIYCLKRSVLVGAKDSEATGERQ